MTSSLVSPSLQGFSFFLFILSKQLVSGEADMSSGLWHDSMLPSRLEECLAIYMSPGSHWGSWLPRACLGRPSDLWFEKSIMLLSVKMSLCFLPWRHPSELTSQHPSYYLGPPVAYRSFWTASTFRTDQTLGTRTAISTHPSTPHPRHSQLYSVAWSPSWMQYQADPMVPWERSSLLRGHQGSGDPSLVFLESLGVSILPYILGLNPMRGREESEHSQPDPCLPFLALVLESFPKSPNNCMSCRIETSLLSYLHSAIPYGSLNITQLLAVLISWCVKTPALGGLRKPFLLKTSGFRDHCPAMRF